MKVGPGILSNR